MLDKLVAWTARKFTIKQLFTIMAVTAFAGGLILGYDIALIVLELSK